MILNRLTPLAALGGIAFAIASSVGLGGCGGEDKERRSGSEPQPGDRGGREAAPTVVLDVAPPVEEAISAILRKVEAGNDEGWDSEVVSAAAHEVLEALIEPLRNNEPIDRSEPRVVPLRPEKLSEAFVDGELRVLRQADPTPAPAVSLGEALAALRSAYRADAELHIKLKTFRVTPLTDGRFTTEVIFLASGSGREGVVQQNARWRCRWARGEEPALLGIELTDYEEIVPLAGGGLRFEDVTASAFREAPSFARQLMRGIDHWRPRLQSDFGVGVNGLEGIAIGDADGDGLEDIFVCQPGGLPNKLYLRRPDGTLSDHSAAAGLDWMEVTRAALFADLDNDGDQDLAMSQGWYWVLMENDGKGRFTKRDEQRAPSNLRSLAAADYDLDGDLDLFFCGRNPAREFEQAEGVLGYPMPYHDANNGGANLLLRNDGSWTFKDVTVASGLDRNNRRYSFAASWADYDLDGDSDLYVANDFGRNNLYRNDGGEFVDVAAELGVEDMSAGMSATWGDYNNDGRPDLYISNMFSSAGNRITYQRHFRAGTEASKAQFQRHARGNTLFANTGTGFEDVSEAAAVTMGRWAWGAKFADLNNDGWDDLYVANGFITTEDSGDL